MTTAIEIPPVGSGGTPALRGHLAVPAGDAPAGGWPAVVVVHEIFDVDDVMRRQVDRLAAAGFLALLPDLFTAGGARRCLRSTFRALRRGSGRPFADIDAARAWLAADPRSNGRVGIVGFCMGGGFALVAAVRGFDVASANYGVLPKDPEHALAGACPVVGSYGGRDRGLGERTPRRLEQVLTAVEVEHEITVYPDAGHSFLNDAPVGPAWLQPVERVMGIGPEPASAAQAWTRIDAFLHRHLDTP